MRNKIDISLIKALAWTVAGMLAVTFITHYLVFGNFLFWEVMGRRSFISLTIICYLVFGIAVLRVNRFSFREQLSISIFIMTIIISVLLSVVAIGRLYYSRKYLIVYYFLSIAWCAAGLYLYRNPRSFFYLICPGGLGNELSARGGRVWELLEKPELSKRCDGIIVDLHEKISPEWMRFIANVSLTNIPIYHAATVYEKVTGRISLKHLNDGVLSNFKMPKHYFRIKSITEKLVIIALLPVIGVVALLTALAVKIDSKGPVFFLQERMGRGGKPFKMYKFRTMTTDSEADGAKFTSSSDKRITSIGRFLRKFRIDEIPQLLNVLKGNMSIIGPRPEQVGFAKEFEENIPFYAYRHLVNPGITGWAQVTHGYAAGIEETEEKLGYDLYYIKYMGVWLDLLIIIKTLKTILTGFGSK